MPTVQLDIFNSGVTDPNLTKYQEGCTDTITDYSSEIKIAIFQFILEH